MFVTAFAVCALAAEKSGVCDDGYSHVKWDFNEETGVLTFVPSDGAKGLSFFQIGLVEVKEWDSFVAAYGKSVKEIHMINNESGRFAKFYVDFSDFTALEKVICDIGIFGESTSKFVGCTSLTTFGTTANIADGVINLSKISSTGNGRNKIFKGATSIKEVITASVDIIYADSFAYCTSLAKVTINAKTKNVENGAFGGCTALTEVTVEGNDTAFAGDKVFAGLPAYPTIKAHTGSAAEKFAKEKGYRFIDLDTGEETAQTRTDVPEKYTEGTGDSAGEVTPIGTFDPVGATDKGHASKKYNGQAIVNTWWAYYADTKTLEFATATKSYNETGGSENCDGETSWAKYKSEIEHIIIGGGINKISGGAFANCTSLIDVKYPSSAAIQVDAGAFTGCGAFTTMWRDGTERIEGRVDATGFLKINEVFSKTAIKEVVLPKSAKSLISSLPLSVQRLYASEITDDLIKYCEDNLIDLIKTDDPSVIYKNYVEIDPTLPSCGARSVYGFDEATGTLTVYGAGSTSSIVNYYGGGSKKQPWFSIRNKVKHVVISDTITGIGKYSFCEFKNLETLELPDKDLEIENEAFEKCTNLRSVYRRGIDAIEGTADLSKLTELNPFVFAYDCLIANVILGDGITSVGDSTFEDNVNLTAIYGVPAGVAEAFAKSKGLEFHDSASETPAPVKCKLPETEADTSGQDESDAGTDTAPETAPETEASYIRWLTGDEAQPDDAEDGGKMNVNVIIIIVAAIVTVAVISAIAVIIIRKRHVK